MKNAPDISNGVNKPQSFNFLKLPEVVPLTFLAVIFVSLFVIATFFTGFNIYLYAACLFFVSLFILKNPEVGLYAIIILTFIFERFFTLQPITWGENVYKIYPLDILILATILSFLIWQLRQSKKIAISRQGIFIIIFAVFSFFSAIYGIWRGGETVIALSTFKNYALYAVFFFLIINIIDSREKLKRLVKVFLIAGAGLLIFVLIGWARRTGLWIEYTPLSTFGTRLLAPTHAFYLSLVVLLALNLYAFGKKLFREFAFPIILIQLLGILGALSRHLYLALVVGVLFSIIFLSREPRKNLLKIIFTQAVLILVLIAIFSWASYLLTGDVPILGSDIIKSTIARVKTLSLGAEDESSYFRIYAWKEAWDQFSKNPILGIGFGHKLTFDFFGYPTKIEVRELHNDFIAVGLQMGILGFLSFLAVNLHFLISVLKNIRKINDDLKPYLFGAAACFVLFIFAANFGVYFDINLLVIFYWIMMGMGIAILKLSKG